MAQVLVNVDKLEIVSAHVNEGISMCDVRFKVDNIIQTVRIGLPDDVIANISICLDSEKEGDNEEEHF